MNTKYTRSAWATCLVLVSFVATACGVQTPTGSQTTVAPQNTVAVVTEEAPTPIPTNVPAELPATTPQFLPKLGTTLGQVSLQMRQADVQQLLGDPALETSMHGLGSPQWEYSDGLVVFMTLGNASQPNPVWKIMAKPPFTGQTAEGYKLGETEEVFRAVYKDFRIQNYSNPKQVQIDDQQGTLLNVTFDDDGKSNLITVTAQECTQDCNAALASPTTPSK